MNLYCVSWNDANGSYKEWTSSLAGTRKVIAAAMEQHGITDRDAFLVQRLNVPTTKEPLIKWLNHFVGGDG